MKLLISFFVVFILIINTSLFSQTKSSCSSPEAKQFDFWVGNWKAEWQNKDGSKSEGSNTIKKILGGCVVEENFNGNPGIPLEGKSFSVYNSRSKMWQQTWVDNQGGYLDFTGKYENGKMILSREATLKDGKSILQRMVYYNIEKSKFDWDWEISRDKGKTWELKWRIYYTRKRLIC